ncbi:Thymidylate kinase [Chlamydiales bacterium STE3]|nr:Thymidylate kinase [Chlamydiales bacterium STE3]
MNQKIKLPLFVSFEGGEGAGKTSLINALSTYLYEHGLSPVVTREPGGTRLSEEIRHMLLHPAYDRPLSDKAELFLFLAARAQHVQEVILPSLKEDKIVLCDRFHDSTVAYQGFAQKLGEEEVTALTLFAADDLKPDLTIYLDIDPGTGLTRAKSVVKDFEGQVDRIEAKKLEFHEKVRQAFLRIAEKEPQRFKIISGQLSKDEVFEQAVMFLENVR